MERTEGSLSLLGAAEAGFEKSASEGEASEVSAGADGEVEDAMLCLGGYTVVLMGGERRHEESSDRARGDGEISL